jgi:TonB family protein
MRDAGTPGAVVLKFRILEDGRVDSASIQIASSSAEPFNAPSIRTLRSLAFYPARVIGRPVKVWSVLPISFQAESLRSDSTPQLGMESRLELVDFAARHYPAALKESLLQGRVEVRFRVQPDGRPIRRASRSSAPRTSSLPRSQPAPWPGFATPCPRRGPMASR